VGRARIVDRMRRVSRRSLLGLRVEDHDGHELGRVVDTWPADGGWELELVVVRLKRFGERRMLPVDALVAEGRALRTAYSRVQVEDSPALDRGRWDVDAPYRAKAYWGFEETPRTGSLTPRCRRSSGFSATERPSPTSPSPTPTAS
jgi:hypothetical protein